MVITTYVFVVSLVINGSNDFKLVKQHNKKNTRGNLGVQTRQSDYIISIFFCCIIGLPYGSFPNILDWRDRLQKVEYTEEKLENYSRLVPEIQEKLGTQGCENPLATCNVCFLNPESRGNLSIMLFQCWVSNQHNCFI